MAYSVDWTTFNNAVREHAARETARFSDLVLPVPIASPPTPPPLVIAPPDTSGQFLRRAQGVALVVLAVGASVAVAIGAQRFFAPQTVIEHVAVQAPGVPVAAITPAATAIPPPAMVASPALGGAEQPAPEVVNYTRFATRRSGNLEVTTGWRWSSSHDPSPSDQYCYISLSDPNGGAPRNANLAVDGKAIPFDPATMHPLTAEQYKIGLTGCVWFTPPQRTVATSIESEEFIGPEHLSK